MCSDHITLDNYRPLVKQINHEVSNEDQKLIRNLLIGYYHNSKKNVKYTFDINHFKSLDDDTFKSWFAFTKCEFDEICKFIPPCKCQHVAVLMCKLRTVLTNEQLAFLFGITERSIANLMDKGREAFIENMVPKFLNSIDRETFLTHSTPMSKIFDIPEGNSACIFDATYSLVQKTKIFGAQKML